MYIIVIQCVKNMVNLSNTCANFNVQSIASFFLYVTLQKHCSSIAYVILIFFVEYSAASATVT